MKLIYLLALLVSLPALSNTNTNTPEANSPNYVSFLPTYTFEIDPELQSHTGTIIFPGLFGGGDGSDKATTGTILDNGNFSAGEWLNNNTDRKEPKEMVATIQIPTGEKKLEETPPSQIKRVSLKEEIEQCGEDFSLTADPASLSVSCQMLQAALKVERSQLAFLGGVIEHNKKMIEHRENTYNLQYVQSFGITALILTIVIVGLILSWRQFTRDAFIQPTTKDAEGNVIPPASTTTVVA